MPLTRATRKRLSAGEGGCGSVRSSHAGPIEIPVDHEPSLLPPRAKRQRRTSNSSVAKPTAAAAKQRKGRALKPVATNAKSNTTQQQEPPVKRGTRGASSSKIKTAAAAASKPKPKRGRAPKTVQQQVQKDEDQEQHFVVPETEPSSARATLAVHEDDAPETAAAPLAAAAPENPTLALYQPDPSEGPTEELDPYNKPSVPIDTSTSSYQNGVPDDIDARDAHDPLSVTDYVADMYEHFRSKEELCAVDFMYMGSADHGKQPNINESMRCILVDWLIEVHYKFKLFPETLYLTINVLDRFLAQTKEIIMKRDLQLVGVTALLVSAKYEEMYVPELRDLTYICDGAYTEAKILRMEENILKTLNYNVTVPTPHTFLVRFLKAAHADKLMAQLSCFLLDGTLLSLENLTCQWRPSQLAAAAILLARRQLGRHNWSPTLVSYSLYREEDVLPVARALLKNKHRLEQNRELMALGKKYSKTKYGKVSHIKFEPLEYLEAGSGDESMESSL
eukprot:jgi/Psemu1/328274/estExt_fgenesh1_pg.C_11510001